MSDRRLIRVLLLNFAVALSYAVTGWLGLQLPYYGEHVTLIWVPSAIALAAAVLAGPVIIPGIFLGSFSLNISFEPAQPAGAALIALSNTLAPALAGMVLVRRYGFRPQLDRVRDAFAYLGVGVLGSGAVAATFGALWLCAFGEAPWGDYPSVWLTWFGGEAIGLLIVGPLILTWLSAPDPLLSRPADRFEKSAMFVSVAVVSAIVLAYGEHLVSLPYAFGLLLLWILFRAGLRETSLAVAAVALALIVGTVLGVGPFIAQTASMGMLSLWMSLAVAGSALVTAGGLLAERDQALHQQRRLLSELDHRVKNALATVVALAERSGDGAVDLDDFRARFIGRVRAMARTHEGLARSNWGPIEMTDIVAMTLTPFGGTSPDRLLASGDSATLPASKVAPLMMVLHELATNAAKYGAWSRNRGRVAVAWARNGDGALRLSWRETGGPALSATPTPGYGLRLVEEIARHELRGLARLDFGGDGFACTLHIPEG